MFHDNSEEVLLKNPIHYTLKLERIQTQGYKKVIESKQKTERR
jgi:hypothetical protein